MPRLAGTAGSAGGGNNQTKPEQKKTPAHLRGLGHGNKSVRLDILASLEVFLTPGTARTHPLSTPLRQQVPPKHRDKIGDQDSKVRGHESEVQEHHRRPDPAVGDHHHRILACNLHGGERTRKMWGKGGRGGVNIAGASDTRRSRDNSDAEFRAEVYEFLRFDCNTTRMAPTDNKGCHGRVCLIASFPETSRLVFRPSWLWSNQSVTNGHTAVQTFASLRYLRVKETLMLAADRATYLPPGATQRQ